MPADLKLRVTVGGVPAEWPPGAALALAFQGGAANALADAVRGGVDPSLDTLAKLAGTLALPVPAQRFSQADGNLVAGQTVFTVTGGYTPGIVAVYRNGLILSTADYVATNGSTVQITYAVTADEIVDIRPNRGGALLNAAPAVHAHAIADVTGLADALADKPLSFRNRLRNAGFTINQRAVTGTVTLAAGAYGHDGFKGGASGCTYTFARANGTTTITITAGTLVQVIEGGLYLTEGGTYTLSWVGTAQGRVNGGAYAASPITVTGLVADANATVEWGTGTLALPQFEPGTRRTAFERRDDEMRRCQRYYWQGIMRGNITRDPQGNNSYISGQLIFGVPLRSQPTVTYTDSAGNVGKFTISGTNNIAPQSGGISPLTGGQSIVSDAYLSTSYYGWWQVMVTVSAEL